MSKWKVGLYLAAIFAAGSVSGWVIATKTLKQQAFTAPKSDEIAASLRTCMYTRLNLTEGQKSRVDAIIERSSKEMQSIHKERLDRIRVAVSNRNAQLAAVLTPDQQKEFERIEKERRDSWRQKDSAHGKPGGRDGRRSKEKERGLSATNAVLEVFPSGASTNR